MRGMIESLESRQMFSAAPFYAIDLVEQSARIPAIHASAHIARPPTAKLLARPITSSVASYTIKVTYHSTAAINASTIATGNLSVSGPNGYSNVPVLAAISPATNSKTIVAVYSVAPPNGVSFSATDNGTYTVTLAAGAVSDINGLSASTLTPLGTFKTHIKVAPRPTAMASAVDITTAVTSYAFKVTYRGSAAINGSSIATGNLTVSGPNGFSTSPTLVSKSPAGNSRKIVAVYSVTLPSGAAFGSGNNGAYTISLAGGSVADVAGSTVAGGTLGTFSVNIPAPVNAFPNMVGTYNGTNVVPSAGSYHYVQLTVAAEDASGNISGSWVTDVGAVFNFTGTVASDGTFSYTFSTPANTNHATGPVTGNGTGSGAGTSMLSFSFTASSAGFTAPGTMSVTKA